MRREGRHIETRATLATTLPIADAAGRVFSNVLMNLAAMYAHDVPEDATIAVRNAALVGLVLDQLGCTANVQARVLKQAS